MDGLSLFTIPPLALLAAVAPRPRFHPAPVSGLDHLSFDGPLSEGRFSCYTDTQRRKQATLRIGSSDEETTKRLRQYGSETKKGPARRGAGRDK
ncbi:hypothetical protein GCM10020370_42570 [Paenibacillus hodogayensis]